ncbi:MAG: hypothetical protein LUC83_09980 [Clostridiales bacterium]|nr:hypothetical protein [Clostridiales bacterium]
MEKIENTLQYIMEKYGIPADPEELDAVLHDYNSLARQNRDMIECYCQEDKPVRKDGAWYCPACGQKVVYNHTHCHWCGKKMGWGRMQR